MNYPATRFERITLGAVAIILSLMLWVQAQTIADQATQQRFQVRLLLKDVPNNLADVDALPLVEVIAEGPRTVLADIKSEEWVAEVNLRQGKQGRQSYAVRLNGPSAPQYRIAPAQPFISITLEPVKRVSARVDVEETGQVPDSIVYSGVRADPAVVTLIGPAPLVDKVAKLRATLNLTGLRVRDRIDTEIEALDSNGKRVPKVDTDPKSVQLRPQLMSSTSTIVARVSVRWKGQPAFGYQVRGYTVSPEQIELAGETKIVEAIKQVLTDPVDISELKADRTFQAKLEIPPGASPAAENSQTSGNMVTITVQVSKTSTVRP
ncbi:MAG: hypothetical protein JST40_03085 [Armatimonadetes bacterium]|nr:hypothetical protein [Armatimonadota bacterium]